MTIRYAAFGLVVVLPMYAFSADYRASGTLQNSEIARQKHLSGTLVLQTAESRRRRWSNRARSVGRKSGRFVRRVSPHWRAANRGYKIGKWSGTKLRQRHIRKYGRTPEASVRRQYRRAKTRYRNWRTRNKYRQSRYRRKYNNTRRYRYWRKR